MQLLSSTDAADFLQVTAETLYGLLEKEGLPGAKVGGQWRFLEEDLIDWFKSRRKGAPAQIDAGNVNTPYFMAGIYENLIGATFDAVLVSENNFFIDCNPAAEALYGYTKLELKGQAFHILMAEEFHYALDETLRTNRTGIVQRVHRRKDGTVFPVEVSMLSLDGKHQGTRIGAIRNLSQCDNEFFEPEVQETLKRYPVRSIERGKLAG